MTHKGIYNSDDMYDFYREEYPEGQITRSQYKAVIRQYNQELIEELKTGKQVPLKNSMGAFQLIRIERNYKKPRVNYAETMKLRKQGIQKTVYYTDDEYIRIAWKKYIGWKANYLYYRFTPARGKTGMKSILSSYYRDHPELHHKFELQLTRE